MRVDLHVHTRNHSACAVNTADEMVAQAVKLGLDGLVITDHQYMWADEEWSALQGRFPEIRLFRGIEVTDPWGNDFLIYGASDPSVFWARRTAAELVTATRMQGGAIVLAHPYRYADSVPRALWEHPLDGVEIRSCNIPPLNHARIEQLQADLGVGGTAGSDAHRAESVGRYYTCFDDWIRTEAELARALGAQAYTTEEMYGSCL